MKEQNIATQAAALVDRKGLSRRRFLGYAGALAGAGMITLQSCNKDNDNTPTTVTSGTVDLGSNDVGILNYAYALEQLEAAFYTEVINRGANVMSQSEVALLTDIRDHEVAHREFFRKAITGAVAGTSAKIIPDLTPDFSKINFSDRGNILATAQTFEDLGVAAYNGAGKLIASPTYLLLAGKIVSVEARHAAYIRDLISNGTFASLETLTNLGANDGQGLDGALLPSQVLTAAQPFIKEKISGANLPTS